MRGPIRSFAVVLAVSPIVLSTLAVQPARADDAGVSGPCGTFAFTGDLSCKVQVSGGCTASCTPISFEVSCDGHCTATTTQTCTDDCGTACVARCDPKLLDCFAGCHDECDAPTAEECRQKHPGEDCGAQAKAQCDMHCKDSCKVPPSNCEEHCNKCCFGSCQTQVNFDCDFGCMAEVKGSCQAQCTKPAGGIFCNGQFVNATDVEKCIAYLATRGLSVDTSARASVACGANGCDGDVESSAGGGCSVAHARSTGPSGAALALVGALLGAIGVRRRRTQGRGSGLTDVAHGK
jgi:MYXO-CTERM domain-containing protein